MRKTFQIDFQRFQATLLSLGYKCVRENNYRRGDFHIITHPKNNRVEIHIHVDKKEAWAPNFRHRSRKTGKDIEQELRNITRRLG